MIATHKRRARLTQAIQYLGSNSAQVIAALEDGKSQFTMSRGFIVVRDSNPASGVKSIYTVIPSDWIAIGEDSVRRHYSDEAFKLKYEEL